MEELDIFKKRISSLITKSYNGGVTLLNFLDEAKLGILKIETKNLKDIFVFYDGGFNNADNLRAIITPYDVIKSDFKIVVFKIKYNKKFYEINHRSILGSLMGLGIKREFIGDIVINDECYFSCCEEISEYIKDNLKFIGKVPVELEKEEKIIDNIVKYSEKIEFLSSLRLDVFIAAAYNLSRNEAHEYIINGLVYINHILILNPSENIKLGDEISVRRKGRCKLKEIGGHSKSGRIAATLAKRI